jgi:hypothetical protein
VKIELNGQCKILPLFVVDRGGPPLFGRSWLHEIRLDWTEIHSLRSNSDSVATLLEKYSDVFAPDLGTLKDIKAKFTLKERSQPKFLKSRTVPYSLRPAVDKELDR